ncbi:MAG: MBL fold metallo-hydrolase [Bacilli bacterium]|nr:MBL fold metallo-hydrolase [Bacilli bacterium]
MKVIPFYYDDFDDLNANTYVVIDDLNQCVVIDPSKDYDGIINYIEKNNLTLKGVLLTHGHIDHTRGVNKLINHFHVPYFIGFEEETLLNHPLMNCSIFIDGKDIKFNSKPELVSEGEKLHLLNEDIECIHTPFHTSGSYCYFLRNSKLLFTGDFLFKGSVGRSDLPTGSNKDFPHSIQKIMALDDEVKI